MKKTNLDLSSLDRAISLIEQKRAVFKINASDREAMRIIASIMKIGSPRRPMRRS